MSWNTRTHWRRDHNYRIFTFTSEWANYVPACQQWPVTRAGHVPRRVLKRGGPRKQAGDPVDLFLFPREHGSGSIDFTRRGFNGTSTRDIARAAGVSLGNFYNHFSTKEAIFVTLLADYEREYMREGQPLIKTLAGTEFPGNIEAIGRASMETVDRFSGYILLIYVDVVEFEAAHVGRFFENMRTGFAALIKNSGAEKRVAKGVDPAAALMMITWNFFNYFIMERIFRARGHYGMDENEAIKLFTKIFTRGILPKGN